MGYPVPQYLRVPGYLCHPWPPGYTTASYSTARPGSPAGTAGHEVETRRGAQFSGTTCQMAGPMPLRVQQG